MTCWEAAIETGLAGAVAAAADVEVQTDAVQRLVHDEIVQVLEVAPGVNVRGSVGERRR